MSNEKRLKIAIQKSGRLADMSIQLLEKCGISLAKSRDQLLCRAQNFPLDIFLVRDDDIPAFLATDVCQLGIPLASCNTCPLVPAANKPVVLLAD